MLQKSLLAVALKHCDIPSLRAQAARQVAIQLAEGSSHPLYVLTVYSCPALPLVRPPFVAAEVLEESQQILMAEGAALHAEMESKLCDYVVAIARSGVAVVPRSSVWGPARGRSPRGGGDLGRLPRDRRAQQALGVRPRQRAQAICQRAPAIVVMASLGQ